MQSNVKSAITASMPVVQTSLHHEDLLIAAGMLRSVDALCRIYVLGKVGYTQRSNSIRADTLLKVVRDPNLVWP